MRQLTVDLVDQMPMPLPEGLREFIADQAWYKVVNWFGSSGEGGRSDTERVFDINQADILGSNCASQGGVHRPVLDIDFPATLDGRQLWVKTGEGEHPSDFMLVNLPSDRAWLLPSTTPGHYHLYVNCAMAKSAYFEWVGALVGLGVVEPGYLSASEHRGFTALRLPWVLKTLDKRPGVGEGDPF